MAAPPPPPVVSASPPPPPPSPSAAGSEGPEPAWVVGWVFYLLLLVFVLATSGLYAVSRCRASDSNTAGGGGGGGADDDGLVGPGGSSRSSGCVPGWLRPLAKVRAAYFVLVVVFVAVRVAWAGLLSFPSGSELGAFVLNRLALMLYLVTFSVVLVHALRRLYGTGAHLRSLLSRWQRGVIALDVVMALLFVAVVIVILSDPDGGSDREGNPFYEAVVLINVFVTLALALVYAYVGFQLFQRVKNSGDPDPAGERRALLNGGLTVVLVVCFIMRCIFFLYRPITGQYLPLGVWVTFAYIIPEGVPLVLQTLHILTSFQAKQRQQEDIAELYRAHEDSGEGAAATTGAPTGVTETPAAGASPPLGYDIDDVDDGRGAADVMGVDDSSSSSGSGDRFADSHSGDSASY